MLRLFLVIYNVSGGLVHSLPVDVPEKQCLEYAATQTMLHVGQLDVEGYVFNCEWHRAAPRVTSLSPNKRRT
jgi:hypothetical protein